MSLSQISVTLNLTVERDVLLSKPPVQYSSQLECRYQPTMVLETISIIITRSCCDFLQSRPSAKWSRSSKA
ncbi:hypothetical protein PISMIDRAFT_679153 [Pisolithus microcarpus 441]|uniref:Uncharacterized protein n=1 Tax=Pisolithus microcarpus 441 TaxID=765257 RepID=A0A0C9ZMT3_9AGAM|nr:hypothetical protein PISMIDRAFT_679153 [Pisolithus microcarpus 441]